MNKRRPYTPNSQIRNALRALWMRSRERLQALQATGYRCAYCGRKLSKAKNRDHAQTVDRLDVHHLDGVDWDGLCGLIRERLLQTPDRLAPACRECHGKVHENDAVVVPPLSECPVCHCGHGGTGVCYRCQT